MQGGAPRPLPWRPTAPTPPSLSHNAPGGQRPRLRVHLMHRDPMAHRPRWSLRQAGRELTRWVTGGPAPARVWRAPPQKRRGHFASPVQRTLHTRVSARRFHRPGKVAVAGQTAVTAHPWAPRSCPPKCRRHRGSPIVHGFSYEALTGAWRMGWNTLEKPAHLRTAAWLLEGVRAPQTPVPASGVKGALTVPSRHGDRQRTGPTATRCPAGVVGPG